MAVKPIYHLQPESNWMNDPNGPCFIGGLFHMFYQHNPCEAVWGNMTWGHAVSPDMVHWRRLPHALHPDMPYDKDGVFSGCCVVRDGTPHILYTGVFPEKLCLAVGDAGGEAFIKHEGNPILTRGDRELAGWRDPYVWRQDDTYNMLIGSGDSSGGFAESYKSKDLINWKCRELFAHSQEYKLNDEMWECPILLVNDADGAGASGSTGAAGAAGAAGAGGVAGIAGTAGTVETAGIADVADEAGVACAAGTTGKNGESVEAALIISATPHAVTRLITGRLRGSQFTGDAVSALDMGDCLYAPNLVRHPDGRWILFGWQRETGDPGLRAAQGWQGMLTLPRELKLKDGILYTSPAREVDLLRGRHLAHYHEVTGSTEDVAEAPHYEIDAGFQACGGQASFDLLICKAGYVNITISDGHIEFNNYLATNADKKTIHFDITKKDAHHIRIFVDGTSIETYIDSRYALTTRAYPAPEAPCRATQIRISAVKSCIINMLDIYEINNCYN